MFTREAMTGFINTIALASVQLPAKQSQQLLIETAMRERDRVIAESQARSGFVPHYRQVVDGVLDAPLTAVKPFGYILFSWQYLQEIVLEIVHALADRAPVLKGDYLNSIYVFVDDVVAAMGAGDEAHLKEITLTTKRIVIVPTVPYARRLEVGRSRDGSMFVKQVRAHIVEETAITSNKLYGTLADISFNYVDISQPYILKQAYSRARRHDRKNDMVRYPAIIIEPNVA